MNPIDIGRKGNKRFTRFPERGAGYDVWAYDERNGRQYIVGHAVPCRGGRGWYIVDVETNEVILGAGTSTKIGYGLGDACFMLAEQLLAREEN